MSYVVRPQAFMAHIPHSDISGVMIELHKDIRPGSKYLVSCETKPYEHIHFLVEMSDAGYSKFAKRVFIDKYKLRGRASKGLARQYGKLTKIENIERLKIYMLKGLKDPDNRFIYNMEQEYIDKLYEKSFTKSLTPCQKYKSELKNLVTNMCVTEWENHQSYQFIDMRQLVQFWVSVNPQKQPPTSKTLSWLSVEAGVISLDSYINTFYGIDDGMIQFEIKNVNQFLKKGKDKYMSLSQ